MSVPAAAEIDLAYDEAQQDPSDGGELCRVRLSYDWRAGLMQRQLCSGRILLLRTFVGHCTCAEDLSGVLWAGLVVQRHCSTAVAAGSHICCSCILRIFLLRVPRRPAKASRRMCV